MSEVQSESNTLGQQILDQVDAIITNCELNRKPLEIDPARNELFLLFVKAEAAGLVGEDSEPDISADGICKSLSQRWGLQAAAQDSVVNQTRLNSEQLEKMRSLWSVMRMWMEWTYAWERWGEFHGAAGEEVRQSEAQTETASQEASEAASDEGP
ncbi:hypothetical protein [Thalassoglobus polymorphus]|uniref:Uncharacterized protein n=1 Tax=Thalassoglobus polymorphus TaxID=2527994 RepID=A0A517QRA3_9PLAN|nr:hypothetical protein [Thalassoglobus polymorphus]QDT34139.1 hypothetical protein Mal48_33990 [Thalassoglobus polymorphus]